MGVGLVAEYDGAFDIFVEREENERAEYVEQHKPKRLCDRALEMTRRTDAEAETNKASSFFSDEKDGLKRWEAFQSLVKSGFPWKPHIFQMRFFKECISPAVAQAVVGPDWRTYGPGLCEKYGWNHIVKRAIGSGPRREGKTVIVSVVIAALAIVLRCVISVFSTGKRASQGLRDYVVNNYKNSGREDRLPMRGTGGAEKVKVYCGIHANTFVMSELNFYPANEKIAKRVRSVVRRCIGFIYFLSTGVCLYACDGQKGGAWWNGAVKEWRGWTDGWMVANGRTDRCGCVCFGIVPAGGFWAPRARMRGNPVSLGTYTARNSVYFSPL